MKHIICPTVLAESEGEYAAQIKNIAEFAKRIQIDLMDGDFAGPKSLDLDKVWWPSGVAADIHLMYRQPMDCLKWLHHLKPHMVIIHAEADVHHMQMAAELHTEGIEAGLAVLPQTPISEIEDILSSFDHLLIFSGDLGRFGGNADLSLASKIKAARSHHPDLEIGWDGGVNPENAVRLVELGVDVLNAGGYIQNANDPAASYDRIVRAIA